jgi:16S rRNA (guanine(966)-N(2))-methyltransferase RsmD
VRVIAGTAKGTPLQTIEGNDITRPTLEKVKEAIFGSIQFQLDGAVVIDLFAGSGALGIEALSRGASRAYFVDDSVKALRVLKKNVVSCGFSDRAVVMNSDFRTALGRIGEKADFVFLDPPYRSGYYEEAISLIREKGLLKKGGTIIAEHDRSVEIAVQGIIKEKRYGRTLVTYIRGTDDEDSVSGEL